MLKRLYGNALVIGAGAGTMILSGVQSCFADFTLPTLPTADLETAGTAVAALVATAVVIGVVIRILKRA